MAEYKFAMQQVLIFDYDGVIVDSLSIFMQYFFDACRKQGYSTLANKQEFLRLFDGNMFEQMMQKGMNMQIILSIVQEIKEGLMKHQQEINLFPNIKTILEKLAINHTLIISTSNETTVVLDYLKKRNLNHLFEEIYGSDIEPSKVKKIRLIQKHFKSNNYIYIGDTIGDIREAQQANINTVAVTWGWHKKSELLQADPDLIAHDPKELLALITAKSSLGVDYKQVKQ
jgi:phosphoglycolate phosphatase